MNNATGHTAARTAMRVSVFNIILNLLSAIGKAVTGLLTDNEVLVRDAIHSSADTLCTVLVLSGIGFAVKKPGALAEKLQSTVILLLAVVIGCSGIGMAVSGVQYWLGSAQPTPASAEAVAVAVGCVVIKAAMSLLTVHFANRLDSDILLADAYHHRSDCISSLLVLVSVACSYFSLSAPDIIARLVLGVCLLFSARSLALDAVRKLRNV